MSFVMRDFSTKMTTYILKQIIYRVSFTVEIVYVNIASLSIFNEHLYLILSVEVLQHVSLLAQFAI